MEGKCFVYFEDPFWVAVFERYDESGYRVCRHIFGSEPNDAELHQFALLYFYRLRFSVPTNQKPEQVEYNFKRRQREARRLMENSSHLKKAWEAIKDEHARYKADRQQINHEKKEAGEQQVYQARRLQKKEKHRGH
ncbi:MAG: YjdF family protein [Anaerolineae bacterium]|nr:YjdF family protein [Anaerolineae bacterium]